MSEVQAEPVTPGIIETIVEQTEQPAAVAEEQKPDAVEGEESQEASGETTEQQEVKKQSKFQRRLERQKTARIEAETENRLLRERLEKLEAQSKPAQGSDEPQRDQFDDYETYLRAVAKYDGKQAASETIRNEREQAQGREKQTRQAQSEEQIAKAWVEREKAFEAVTKDYQATVMPYVEEDLGQLSDGARRLLIDSEIGPQLLHHLANHPEVSERIADLSPLRQIAEIGKLEDKLSAPVKKTSNAPAPANHVNTGKTGQKDPAKMNQVEYRVWMRANGSRFA